MSVHEVAASGFDAGADAYERARPTYPDAAVAWLLDGLGIDADAIVADVAAGTGKFTRSLLGRGSTLIAVEPVAGMRAQFVTAVRGVPVLGATAEALPFRDESLHAITVAQAIHWFDPSRALAELHRVLRPGGRLGVIGNHRDRSVPWVDALWTIIDRVERDAPWRSHQVSQQNVFADQEWFTTPAATEFPNEQVLTVEAVIDRMRSISHVAALAPREQAEVLEEIHGTLETGPETTGRSELVLPYRTDVCWTERIAAG